MKPQALLLGAMICTGAMAQSGAPAEVPKDHWAFSAVDNLFRARILKGYPEGTYKGSRPVSRFEMATTLAATIREQQRATDGLSNSIKNLTSASTDWASNSDADGLRRQVALIRDQVASMRRQREDVDSLTARFQGLHEQMQKLRQELSGMRRDLDGMNGKTKG